MAGHSPLPLLQQWETGVKGMKRFGLSIPGVLPDFEITGKPSDLANALSWDSESTDEKGILRIISPSLVGFTFYTGNGERMTCHTLAVRVGEVVTQARCAFWYPA